LKIGLYSPYWSTLGGGEKYMLDIARCFPNEEIIIFGADDDFRIKAKERFNFSHQQVSFVKDIKNDNGKLIKEKFKKLDIFFYQCDGSLFFPTAKKNILLIQSPVHSPNGSLKNKIKLRFWQKIVCNSVFTANYVKRKTDITPRILNPSIEPITSLKKENMILSVGRFFPHLHSKKQEVLIDVYKELYNSVLCHSSPSFGGTGSGWNLILVGSVANSDMEYFNKLKEQAKGYPIEFCENASFEQIKELYGKAKIFWHAAGFGEDLNLHPERAEHFGISTVEAISAGCYPLVFKGGGQIEIIGDNPEFYWETKEELADKTKKIINDYESLITNYEKIRNMPDKYSFDNFKRKLLTIIK
jgi:hypothetical protein